MVASIMLVLAILLPTGVNPPLSTTGTCDGSTTPGPGWFDTQLNCEQPPSTNPGEHSTASGTPFYTSYRWRPACGVKAEVGAQPCPMDTDGWCPEGETLFWLQGLHEGVWYDLGRRCTATEPTLDEAAPLVTSAMVLREFERVPLPRLASITQPAGSTLVNFATIFRVDAEPLERTLTLAGQRVDLDITPSSFHWVHGDGTTSTTRTPGRAYPSRDVVHRYQHAHVTVRHHVEVTWGARWRLNGGAWQDVPGTVTTVGPATALRIAEATPALSGDGH